MTGTLYVSGFLVGTSYMTATIAGNAATVAAGRYMPGISLAAAATPFPAPWNLYTEFSAAVKSAFDTAGGGPWTVAFSNSTGKYTVSRATTFTLAFSTPADLRLRAALGFTGNKSGANTYTSDEVAKFCLFSEIGARTAVSDVYEPDGLTEDTVADDGTPYGTTLRTTELWSDWTQAMEPKASVFTLASTRVNDWCWQEFFAHHRATHPFVALDANPAYVFRAEGASFKPQRVTADYDGQWNVPFKCRDLGSSET